MATYDFVLIIDNLDLTDNADLDRLFESGLDDSTPSVVDSVQYLDITRDAGSYGQALSSALRQVKEAGGVVRHILQVDEAGQTFPGLMSLADLARRTGWTREYVRLLAAGKRGPGGFPSPHRDSSLALYAWTEVLDWLVRHPSAAESAELIRDINREQELAGLTRFANLAFDFDRLGPDVWERARIPRQDVAAFIEGMQAAIAG